MPKLTKRFLDTLKPNHDGPDLFAFGTLTPDEARTKAKRLLAEADSGSDPSAQRHEAREVLTVAELCNRYLEQACN